MEHYEIFKQIRQRYLDIQDEVPLDEIKNAATLINSTDRFSFESLFGAGRTLIGFDARQADYQSDAERIRAVKEFIFAGIDFLCINTEPLLKDASYSYFETASKSVKIPILRKDPTVCEYQIYQAKVLGADAVYLSRFLSITELKHLIDISKSIGVTSAAEVSCPSDAEKAAIAGAAVISVTSNVNSLDKIIKICEYTPGNIYSTAYCNIKTHEDYLKALDSGIGGIILSDPLSGVKDKKAYLNSIIKG